MPRSQLFLLILYLTFIGGATYTESTLALHILHQAIITILLGSWLIRLWRTRQTLPHTPLDWPLLVYGGVLAAATLSSLSPRISAESCWTPLIHVLLFYLLVEIMRSGRQRWVFEALFLGAAVAVVLSALEFVSWYFGIAQFIASFNQGWPQIGAGLLPPSLRRLSLAMNNANLVGNYAAILLPVVAAWALSIRQRDLRLGAWLLCGGLALVEALSQSRGGWMSAAAGCGVLAALWFWQYFKTRRDTLLAAISRPRVLLPLGLAALLALTVGGYLFMHLFIGRGAGDSSRLDMWRSALAMLRDHPVFGVGPDMFGVALRSYRNPTLARTLEKLSTAHNLPLNTAAELGLAGLAARGWLVVAFAFAWWRRWQRADRRRRLRLGGCLAAFVGFSTQSMVDTFKLTPMLLPLLIYAAYTLGTGPQPADRHSIPLRRRGAPALAGALLIAYALAFVPIGAGRFHLMRSTARLGVGNREGALRAAEQAAAIDPALDLYQLQIAYVLGHLAEAEPDIYLDRAISAHEDALALRPNRNYELAHANLGALYAQHGDYAAAIGALERAVAIHSRKPVFWLTLGRYREALGDDAHAQDAYVQALSVSPTLAGSGFWHAEDAPPAREAAIAAAIAEIGREQMPFKALEIALAAEDPALVADLVPPPGTAPSGRWEWCVAVGRYYHAIGAEAEAIVWLDKAAAQRPVHWEPYSNLSSVYLATGDTRAAERAARIALFIDPGAILPNYTLAQLAIADDDWEQGEALLKISVPPLPLLQSFTEVSYGPMAGHLVGFNYLPQLRAPGVGRTAYAPWFLLAAHYAETGRFEEAAYVYEVITKNDPYLVGLPALDAVPQNP